MDDHGNELLSYMRARTNVHYYFDPADANAAKQMQDELAAVPALAALPRADAPRYVPLQAAPGQLEVWLPSPG